MKANRPYKGMLLPIGSVDSKNPDVYNEIKKRECDCSPMGHISDTIAMCGSNSEVWFICSFHSGYLRALKDIEIYEYELRMQD